MDTLGGILAKMRALRTNVRIAWLQWSLCEKLIMHHSVLKMVQKWLPDVYGKINKLYEADDWYNTFGNEYDQSAYRNSVGYSMAVLIYNLECKFQLFAGT